MSDRVTGKKRLTSVHTGETVCQRGSSLNYSKTLYFCFYNQDEPEEHLKIKPTLMRAETHGHQVLLQLLNLRQVHFTEQVRGRHRLRLPTRPSALSVCPGRRPRGGARSDATLEVTVTSVMSDRTRRQVQNLPLETLEGSEVKLTEFIDQ